MDLHDAVQNQSEITQIEASGQCDMRPFKRTRILHEISEHDTANYSDYETSDESSDDDYTDYEKEQKGQWEKRAEEDEKRYQKEHQLYLSSRKRNQSVFLDQFPQTQNRNCLDVGDKENFKQTSPISTTFDNSDKMNLQFKQRSIR